MDFEYIVLGLIKGIKQEGDRWYVEFPNDGVYYLYKEIPQNLVGETVILWRGYDDDDNFGIDEVELINSQTTVHFLNHRIGRIGYTIDFETRTWDLRQLQYMRLEVLLPEPAAT